MANFVALGVGEAPFKFISNELDDERTEEADFEEIRGAFMCIRICLNDALNEGQAE